MLADDESRQLGDEPTEVATDPGGDEEMSDVEDLLTLNQVTRRLQLVNRRLLGLEETSVKQGRQIDGTIEHLEAAQQELVTKDLLLSGFFERYVRSC